MARTRKVSDKINRASFEVNMQLTPEEQAIADAYPGPGSYQNATVEDIINNFIISHVGNGKVLSSVPRHEVAYWAQRGLQELSYDILLSEKNIEFELNEALSWPLPSDYVNLVKLVFVDAYGVDRPLTNSRQTTAKQALMQDTNYAQIYDQDGEQLVAGKSESILGFQGDDQKRGNNLKVRNYDQGLYIADIYEYYYSGEFGRRYGLEPEFQNFNGEYTIDLEAGIIYFDSTMRTGDIIGMRYVSDGLGNNDDLANVYVPKLAEDALYAFMLYNLAKVRVATAQLAPMYKKEMSAKMRNAKIRLSKYSADDIAQTLRGRAKWIKH